MLFAVSTPVRAAPPLVMRIPSLNLIYALSVRQLEEESKASLLGWLWLLLKPLIQMIIYVVVFGVILGGHFNVIENETKMEFALGVFLGTVFVQLITDPLQSACGLMQQQANLVKKNSFPLVALPLSRTIAQGMRALLSLLMWSIAAFFVVPDRGWALLMIPLMILPLFLLALGINAGISSLSVYLGDVGQAVQMLGQIVFWTSGVFYSALKVQNGSEMLWSYMRWNPVLRVVEESRNLLIWGTEVNWVVLGQCLGFGAAVCLVGCVTFGLLRRGMADFI